MKKIFAPDLFRKILIESLEDSQNPSYGQVATLSKENRPEVRTVHIRYIPEYETVGFVCNKSSSKMDYLLKEKKISGCWYDHPRLMQFRWLATVELITSETKDEKAQETRKRMWDASRESVRTVYWYEHLGISYQKNESVKLNEVCPSFVTVVCFPTQWDYYELKNPDYRLHKRFKSDFKNTSWETVQVQHLTGKVIT